MKIMAVISANTLFNIFNRKQVQGQLQLNTWKFLANSTHSNSVTWIGFSIKAADRWNKLKTVPYLFYVAFHMVVCNEYGHFRCLEISRVLPLDI